jgi:hypothetical protein
MPAMASALDIQRGVARALIDADHAILSELPLANGRRADLAAVDPAGRITMVEIKSCRADFLCDRKWRDYLGYCDRFYFAVDSDFPCDLLPADEGLIVADRFEGAIIREARVRPLGAARRKAMLVRFARASASRLQAVTDPTFVSARQPPA